MKTKTENLIRCKFCKWRTRKWEGKGKGGPTRAFLRLRRHFIDEHYDDNPKLTAFICNEEDKEILRTLH